jgi:hypothetical protein
VASANAHQPHQRPIELGRNQTRGLPASDLVDLPLDHRLPLGLVGNRRLAGRERLPHQEVQPGLVLSAVLEVIRQEIPESRRRLECAPGAHRVQRDRSVGFPNL